MSGRHPAPADLRSFDRLEARVRDRLLDHVRDCAACRSLLLEDDPTRVFAFLADEPIPGVALDRLTASLHVELDRTERRSRPAVVWGSVAASLLLALLIGVYLVSQPSLPTRSPFVRTLETGSTEVADQIDLDERGGGIELLSPSEAQVYDLTVGETQIVMIFDRGLDI